MDWSGGLLLAVPAQHTSQTCPGCGHVAPENRRTQQQFLCVACGHKAHADGVGAVNILVSPWRGRLWPQSQDCGTTSLGEAGTRRSDYARDNSCIAQQESPLLAAQAVAEGQGGGGCQRELDDQRASRSMASRHEGA